MDHGSLPLWVTMPLGYTNAELDVSADLFNVIDIT